MIWHRNKTFLQFYPQAKFVEGMLEGTPNLRNGFYIEAGAYDGLKFSNSLLFEMRCVMSLTARVENIEIQAR